MTFSIPKWIRRVNCSSPVYMSINFVAFEFISYNSILYYSKQKFIPIFFINNNFLYKI